VLLTLVVLVGMPVLVVPLALVELVDPLVSQLWRLGPHEQLDPLEQELRKLGPDELELLVNTASPSGV